MVKDMLPTTRPNAERAHISTTWRTVRPLISVPMSVTRDSRRMTVTGVYGMNFSREGG